MLAGLGASKILERESVKKVIKVLGTIVLVIFGMNIILNAFGIHMIPGLALQPNSSSAFVQGIILTLSNPITIIFWGSVLTTKIVEDCFGKKELFIFSNRVYFFCPFYCLFSFDCFFIYVSLLFRLFIGFLQKRL